MAIAVSSEYHQKERENGKVYFLVMNEVDPQHVADSRVVSSCLLLPNLAVHSRRATDV